jgi:hypothetical protein
MNKAIERLILWFWIITTSLLDFCLGALSVWIISLTIHLGDDGAPYYKDNIYALPIHEVIILQIELSLFCFLIGLAWSGIILIISERLSLLLKFKQPQNHSFSSLSLKLFKFALITIVLSIALGNITLIYDQIQGRARFDRMFD